MASREIRTIFLPARGGLNSDADQVMLTPTDLSEASNIEYGTFGSRKKRGGTTISHGTATLSGTAATISAIADFWRFGTSASPIQSIVLVAATVSAGAIYKCDAGGTVTSLKAPWSAGGRVPSITIAAGRAIFSDGTDTVQSYDQTSVSTLSTTMPVFGACRYHLRRLFYFGLSGSATKSSTVGYTAAGDVSDATGSDTGSFIFNEDDGDAVKGVSDPWRERLYVFKGPTRGSVHYIAGTGPSDFSKGVVFARAAPSMGHASVITTENDIYWMSRYGFHSMQATQKYGDVEMAYISQPIQSAFNAINIGRLIQASGFSHPTRNIVGWAVSTGTDSTSGGQNTQLFVYNTLLSYWAVWTFAGGWAPASCAVVLSPLSGAGGTTAITGPFQSDAFQISAFQTVAQVALQANAVLAFGDYGGKVHIGDQDSTKADLVAAGTTAYGCTVSVPTMLTLPGKDAVTEAAFSGITSFIRPTTQATCSLTVTVDGRAMSYQIDLSNSAVPYVDTPLEGDTGRAIKLSWVHSQAIGDFHLLGYALRYTPAETQSQESP
jgi:hypothetical protein